jgi:DNA-binding CsgD family transcriptional regulator
MQFDSSNRYFTLAADLVNYTSKNIFLTGKAGTGKTTFLKYIKQNCAKQLAVVAPTGVAAINAGGTTIHSFFQLPFSPFVPGHSAGTDVNNSNSLLSKIKMTGDKRKILQSLELLIIDEISMVRCDLLDSIDVVLRSFRNRYTEPFGGVQLLFIGDMHQLPPVAKETEWNILSQFYSTPYFFSSHVIQQNSPLYISFEKIYRQSDEKFISLLNGVRNDQLDDYGMETLNSLYNPSFKPAKEDGYIILSTHNHKTDKINEEELTRLSTPEQSFKATIEGEFYENSYPADELLRIKVGAQVMFIKNDTEKIRRYYNGKIGTITQIEDDNISVQCKNEDKAIEVRKEKWENIRYTHNKSTQQIDEDIVGSFTQYPLRLAWAITIHKSQGLTFEKAVIDAGAAFAPGQVYVALSRCTSLEGIVLHSRINSSSLANDKRIHHFSKSAASENEIQLQLEEAKHKHQGKLLKELFDLRQLLKASEDVQKIITENTTSFNDGAADWLSTLSDRLTSLQVVADKFQPHLDQFLAEPIQPQENQKLQIRLIAASKYFEEHLKNLKDTINQSSVSTDNRDFAKNYNLQLFDLFTLVSEKLFLFTNCSAGFDATTWYSKKRDFKVPDFRVNSYGGATTYRSNSPHPSLYMKLKQLRDEICDKTGKPVYLVASSKTLEEICQYLPQNLHELGQIGGFGKVKLKELGQKFLNIITEYTEQHNLSSLIKGKEPKKIKKEKAESKTDSKYETLKLFNGGMTVSEIAKIRNFSPQTIEGHLVHYIKAGEINVNQLVRAEKVSRITEVLDSQQTLSLTSAKEVLGDDISYGEIRFVMAWKVYLRNDQNPESQI